MPALILIDQIPKPPAVANQSRRDLDAGVLVTCSNQVPATSYLWTLVDVPIRSALVRGTTGASPTFTFTPDVKGTYVIELEVDGGAAPTDTVQRFGAVESFGAKALGWRYLGAGETDEEDNQEYLGLGFSGDINPRGWATPRDLQMEETEESVWETQNAAVVSPGLGDDRLVKLDSATGKLDPSVVPVSPGTAPPTEYTAGTNEIETLLGLERVIGGVRFHGGDIAPGRVIRFRMIGSFKATLGTDYAKLRLYDMGAIGGAPQAGDLRAEVQIAGDSADHVQVKDQVLTAVAVPTVPGEIYNSARKYEVRLFLDSATAGTKMNVAWGGIVVE